MNLYYRLKAFLAPNRDWWNEWRRLELVTTDETQIRELYAILAKYKIKHYDLAVILASLRIRPCCELKDFEQFKNWADDHGFRFKLINKR